RASKPSRARSDGLRGYHMTNRQFNTLSQFPGLIAWLVLLCLTLSIAAAAGAPADSTPAGAASWPMFRGGQGLLGISASKVPDKLSLLWTFKTQGPVKSSAAIAGGQVFIGSNDTNVYALELQSGRKVWSFKAGDAVESSPLVLGGKVYVGSTDTHLH